jgi:hypothetical protein
MYQNLSRKCSFADKSSLRPQKHPTPISDSRAFRLKRSIVNANRGGGFGFLLFGRLMFTSFEAIAEYN